MEPTEVQDKLRSFWQPPPRLSLSEWADRYFYLSAESSAEAGRWRTLPYQKGIMDSITDPLVERVTIKKSARVGYTKIIGAMCGYYIHQDPCPIMIVQPTLDDARDYSKEEIAPMVRDVPVLAALVSESKAKDDENTILKKLFPGGSLSLVGANSPRGFRRVSRRVVGFDEVDGYPASAGPEGDQIKLGIKRTEYYHNRKIIAGSTPTDTVRTRIDPMFESGDQRRYHVPCPHCLHMDYLVFSEDRSERGHFMRWHEGKPETAHFVCRQCQAAITYEHHRWMMERGEWVAAKPFKGHASFHIWAAYSYSPNSTWAHIAAEFLDSQKSVEELKTFVNTVLGETWKEKSEAPDWERLYNRRETYAIGTVPAGGLFLTAGVDVQKDRIEWGVIAWGRGKRSWWVDYGVELGDTASEANSVWQKLDAVVARRFKSDTGVEMPIAMLAVDANYNSQVVYAWARKYPMDRVIAVRGDHHNTKTFLGALTPVDVSINGVKLEHGYKVWNIGVNVGKSELYGWLRLNRTAEGEEDPPGYVHFPQFGETFFKGLTAEQLVTYRKKTGHLKTEWEVIKGRRNEPLDVANYARAAAAIAGLDRLQETDWVNLERQTAQPAKPVTPAAPPAQPPQKPDPWLPPRPKNWLTR
jgi:phage terminase large subunit GpA-like protein